MALDEVVRSSVEWAVDGEDRTARALAALAQQLADEIVDPGEKVPPVAALAKELRATLTDLEVMRRGASNSDELGAVLSSPVWDASQSGAADVRPARGKAGGGSGKTADAVAKTRGGRDSRGVA